MRARRLAARARADIRNLLKTSGRTFGPRARRDYGVLIERALAMLCEKPKRGGVRRREDLAEAPFVFHLRYARARGAAPKQPWHLIVFIFDDASVSILRVLHDSMDLPQHGPGDV